MYAVLFLLLLLGLAFREIVSPIAAFCLQHQTAFLAIFALFFIAYAVFDGYRSRSLGKGIGTFLAWSQFWLFVIMAVFGMAAVVSEEADGFLAFFTTAVVGVLSYAYASFNYKMLLTAKEESNGHPMYLIAVGLVGWLINFLLL